MTLLGERLRALRGDTPLREIAKVLGVHTAVISRYELGQTAPPPDRLQKLADHFQVPYEELRGLYFEDQFEKFFRDSEARPYLEAWITKRIK